MLKPLRGIQIEVEDLVYDESTDAFHKVVAVRCAQGSGPNPHTMWVAYEGNPHIVPINPDQLFVVRRNAVSTKMILATVDTLHEVICQAWEKPKGFSLHITSVEHQQYLLRPLAKVATQAVGEPFRVLINSDTYDQLQAAREKCFYGIHVGPGLDISSREPLIV